MSASPSPEEALQGILGEVLANRYRVEDKLGEGAMGAVYRARHVKVGRPFAVKVLHPRFLEDQKVLQRFEREAELAGRLHHPNVIGVVDVGETHGLRYMVMDFAEGRDLAELLVEAPMPPHRIIHLTRQLLEGLYHAHEAGLIHRDFKPENVIVERDTHGAEVPRIVDFGIAILREGGESNDSPGRLTTNGLVLGTPHYMAPEQAVADPVDHRIDLFALGIVVYEMLCGKLPFDGTGAEVARANLLLDPPRIAERVPYLEVDPLLEAFARRLMAKKRDARPPTAKAAREILDLIARDREAAAAALGVPLAARPPMTTLPSRAETRDEHPDADDARDLAETPRQVPPMAEPIAIARSDGERFIETDPVGRTTIPPLPSQRRRGPIIGAAVAAAGVLAIAGVVMLGGGGGGGDDKKEAPVAMRESAPPPPAPAQPTPAPPKVEPPTPPPPAQPPPELTKEPEVVKKPPPSRPAPKSRDVAKQKPADPIAKPADPVAIVKPAEPIAKPPAADPAHDSQALVALFRQVKGEVDALERTKGADAVADLKAQLRLIRLDVAMSSDANRVDAAAKLQRIHAGVAKLR